MTQTTAFREGDVDQLRAHCDEVLSVYSRRFQDAGRFTNWQPLIKRYGETVAQMLASDWAGFTAVNEVHNEMCIARALLDNSDPVFEQVEYEPPLDSCSKTIDFRARTGAGLTVYVDVKTIRPETSDRWEQFESVRSRGLFPKNTELILSRAELGGELWHHMFSSRYRMLEYARELEEKIREGRIPTDRVPVVMAFCGGGYRWSEDELEDFAAFYHTGRHLAGDRFAVMESHAIVERGIVLDRTISQFACLRRNWLDVSHSRLNWRVVPPREVPLAPGE